MDKKLDSSFIADPHFKGKTMRVTGSHINETLVLLLTPWAFHKWSIFSVQCNITKVTVYFIDLC